SRSAPGRHRLAREEPPDRKSAIWSPNSACDDTDGHASVLRQAREEQVWNVRRMHQGVSRIRDKEHPHRGSLCKPRGCTPLQPMCRTDASIQSKTRHRRSNMWSLRPGLPVRKKDLRQFIHSMWPPVRTCKKSADSRLRQVEEPSNGKTGGFWPLVFL